MKSKLQRKLDGPGWVEVIFGAVLSLVLGVVIAAAFLVFKPVTTVKEMPKEPVADMVYYLEGNRDSAKSRGLAAKRKLIVQGSSVDFNEDELNTLAMPAVVPPGTKSPELSSEPPTSQIVKAGTPNFRIRESVMQIGVPLQLSAFEVEQKVILQTRGTFVDNGEMIVFEPGELYIGSCPLERLPAVKDLVVKYLVANVKVPDELAAAWRNVGSATLDGSTLRLTAR